VKNGQSSNTDTLWSHHYRMLSSLYDALDKFSKYN